MSLLLQIDDQFLQTLLGSSAIKRKMHLYDRELGLKLHQTPIDLLESGFMDQGSFIQNVGLVPQGNSLLPGLLTKDLLSDRGRRGI
jgi:hypothetical protein